MNYKINKILLLVSILIFGCDNWIEGYDNDPNSSQDVTMDNLLTASQVNVFGFSQNHLARTVAIWMQQMTGTDRQYKSLGLYSFEENDYSSSWQSVYINGGLKDLRKIQSMADNQGPKSLRYKAIAQILESYLIGMAASIWGRIPYSEALDESIKNPKLDSQDQVYLEVQNLLDEAIINLASDTTLIPQNDMFFNGDIEKWKAVAYTLKARYYMHWVESDESNCVAALENANKGISSLEGTLKSLHGTESSEQNMWNQFEQDRSGYMVAGAKLINLLDGNNDPRLNIYFGENEAGSIVGANPNETPQGKSYLNDEFYGIDAPIDIISYEENLLIKAECNYILGNHNQALTMLQNSQLASETKWGISIPDITSSNNLWNNILEEKYITMFLNIEIWNDYKRNCFPEVKYKKSEDDDGNPIYEYPPLRVYYPEDERITNTSIPSIFDQPVKNQNDTNSCE